MADVSVRPALVDDALTIGAIHAETMRLALEETSGVSLETDLFNPNAFAQQWGAAIEEPPSAKHRVIVALADTQIVGFAALAPVPDDDGAASVLSPTPPGGARPEIPAEIIAFEVAPAHQRQGHGSRLLAAIADILRATGAPGVRAWALAGDSARIRFLTSAGFAPLGVRRSYEVGDAVVNENAWWTEL